MKKIALLIPISLFLTGCTIALPAAQQKTPCLMIKGNINQQGEKVYHLPTCAKYPQITVNSRNGERWFCSTQAAEQAGWVASPNCSQ